MKLIDAINHMKDGVKRNRVIIINEDKFNRYLEDIKELNIPIVDVSFKLAELLSNYSQEEKKHEAWDELKKFLNSIENRIIILNNMDYVFSPEVGNLNPVENLNYYSRNNQLIILFLNARKIGNNLIYSKEGLPDYNRMDISQNKFVLGWEDED